MRGRNMQAGEQIPNRLLSKGKEVWRKSYENCMVFATGAAVVALISFNAQQFGSSVKYPAIRVYAQNQKENQTTCQRKELGKKEVTKSQPEKAGEKDIAAEEEEEEEQTENVAEETDMTDIWEEPKVECLGSTDTMMDTNSMVYKNTLCSDEEEYEVLTRIVEAEASGEGLDGKRLVANVIVNRVRCEKFPNTITEVVFQRNQFSPILDGRFYRVTVSQETKEAVNQALSGVDTSQNALFFSARSKADPDNMSWFDNNLKWLFAYGGHEFYTLP